MATFTAKCPKCGTGFEAETEWIGQEGECPSCGSTIPIEAPMKKISVSSIRRTLPVEQVPTASPEEQRKDATNSHSKKGDAQNQSTSRPPKRMLIFIAAAILLALMALGAFIYVTKTMGLYKKNQTQIVSQEARKTETPVLQEEKKLPSITGGFDVALGDIVPSDFFHSKDEDSKEIYTFKPQHPLPNMSYHSVCICPKSKKIYKISGYGTIGESDRLEENDKDLASEKEKLITLFEEKYGEEFKECSPKRKNTRNCSAIVQQERLIRPSVLTRGNRSIEISSETVLTRSVTGKGTSIFRVRVEYIDNELSQRAAEEQMEIDGNGNSGNRSSIDKNSF